MVSRLPVHKSLDSNSDRTLLVPPHIGPHVLPNSPLFGNLLRHARRNRIAVRDVNLDVEKTYGELLSDVLTYRAHLERYLPLHVLEDIRRGDEVYVGVLAAGGYEYAVAMLSVLSLGAAAVPMTVVNPVEEIAYFVTKARQVAIITSTSSSNLAQSVMQLVNERGANIQCFEILPHLPKSCIFTPYEISISCDKYLDENAPAVVIFTSGTTGRPKGAVLRRAYTHETAIAVAEGYDIVPTDVLLHVLPVHHATGIGTSFFPFLVSGACIEFRSGNLDPAWIWNRWRQGGITVFSGVPTIYMRLQWFFERSLAALPDSERQPFVDGANGLRAMLCGSSALQASVQSFWTKVRQGQPILARYGASEFPGLIKVPATPDPNLPVGSIGTTVPGVEVKLSEGDYGELLIKSPYMFCKYLYDEKATLEAHDENGYFKTGDIGQRQGPYYFIIGRASVDIIKSGGYKISAIEIEREVLNLSYVAEAMVVGVEDEEFGQRVGAAVTLQAPQRDTPLTIDHLRDALRDKLPGYKLPTLLRIVEGELPKGATGKVQKKVLGPQYFPVPLLPQHTEVQVWKKTTKPPIMARL